MQGNVFMDIIPATGKHGGGGGGGRAQTGL